MFLFSAYFLSFRLLAAISYIRITCTFTSMWCTWQTDRQTDKQISQKWSIFAGELHPTICVEWAGDHLGLGLYKSIQFDENMRENDIHFRSQW